MILLKFVAFTVLISSGLILAKNNDEECRGELVETVPIGVVFEEQLNLTATHKAFLNLIDNAQQSIQIASFYWTMLCNDTEFSIKESCSRGEAVINSLVNALQRSVKVQIAVSGDSSAIKGSADLVILRSYGAEIVAVDFDRLVGAGVLHTKFIIVDEKSFYLGSANMDWRSISEVKETGILVQNCVQLTEDLAKIFKVYWILGKPDAKIPPHWPEELATQFNISNPMNLKLSGQSVKVFLSNSPPQMNPSGRTNDIDAILHAIDTAESFIGIEVMDYSPSFLYGSNKYWPVIDDALRKAVFERPLQVNFLSSEWKYTRRNMRLSLRSLDQLSKIKNGGDLSVKLVSIPATKEQAKVDHSRVNHSKFIVTDKLIYIGTSNWSADYFVNTGGVGLTIMFEDGQGDQLRALLMSVQKRDWNSKYSHDLYP